MDYLPVQRHNTKFSLITPTLPQCSAMRSRAKPNKNLLDHKEIISEENKKFQTVSLLRSSDLHELYLSSEEDISVSDCNEDFLFASDDSDKDSEYEYSCKEPQEVIAKAISLHMVGKAQMIEINCKLNERPSVASSSITNHVSQRPSHSRLPAINLPLGNFHIDNQHSNSPATLPLHTYKPYDNSALNTNTLKYSLNSEDSNSRSETSSSLSLFRRGSFKCKRSRTNQSTLLIPSSKTGNTLTPTIEISGRLSTLRRVSRNIRNNGVPKINLAYTQGVVPKQK